MRRLIVADIAPRAYLSRHEDILDAMSKLRLGTFSTRAQLDAALAPAIKDERVRQFLMKSVSREGGGLRWKINVEALRANYHRLNEAVERNDIFPGPTLFISGEKSDYLVPGDHDSILMQFPAAAFRVIPNAGHWLHAEAPESFSAAVMEFLS